MNLDRLPIQFKKGVSNNSEQTRVDHRKSQTPIAGVLFFMCLFLLGLSSSLTFRRRRYSPIHLLPRPLSIQLPPSNLFYCVHYMILAGVKGHTARGPHPRLQRSGVFGWQPPPPYLVLCKMTKEIKGIGGKTGKTTTRTHAHGACAHATFEAAPKPPPLPLR